MGKRSGGSSSTTTYEPTEYELDMQRMLRDYGESKAVPTAEWATDVAKAFALIEPPTTKSRGIPASLIRIHWIFSDQTIPSLHRLNFP